MLKGAGKIGPSVREFLSTELKVRVEVPALEVLPDGTVAGGANADGETDVLETTRRLADTDPDIVLGPDSVGTLSFTSGSTGIPKGVKGRHYSLTHFFPWMGERFGLGADSRFTMLSGIAHDPIQRDSACPPRAAAAAAAAARPLTRAPQSSRRSSSARRCTCRRRTTSARPAGSRSGWRTRARR